MANFHLFVEKFEICDEGVRVYFSYKVEGRYVIHRLTIHDEFVTNDVGLIGELITIEALLDGENWTAIIDDGDTMSMKYDSNTCNTSLSSGYIGHLLRAHYGGEDR